MSITDAKYNKLSVWSVLKPLEAPCERYQHGGNDILEPNGPRTNRVYYLLRTSKCRVMPINLCGIRDIDY